MNARFAPILYPDVIARPKEAPGGSQALTYRPNLLCLEEAADDMGVYAEGMASTFMRPKPADPDDVFSEDDTEDVEELLASHPVNPSGKWVGIGVDACVALLELQTLIGDLDFFSAGDTGLGRLQQASERANSILQRAGYRNGNAAL